MSTAAARMGRGGVTAARTAARGRNPEWRLAGKVKSASQPLNLLFGEMNTKLKLR